MLGVGFVGSRSGRLRRGRSVRFVRGVGIVGGGRV
jgi:hypothetical protein